MRQYLVDEEDAWKNDKMVWDGSYILQWGENSFIHFIYLEVQLQHAWDGNHSTFVCTRKPWYTTEADSAPCKGPVPHSPLPCCLSP